MVLAAMMTLRWARSLSDFWLFSCMTPYFTIWSRGVSTPSRPMWRRYNLRRLRALIFLDAQAKHSSKDRSCEIKTHEHAGYLKEW
jgi:hypothetical protein